MLWLLSVSVTALAQSHLEALYSQTVADERAIETLLMRFNCSHAYFDMGANIGVQIRKLHEGALYRNAPVLHLFDATFGPAPHCNVCAIGIEPNPLHATRLSQLQAHYETAGVGVLILMAAVSDADGVMRLTGFNRTDRWIQRHGGPALQIAAAVDEGGTPASARSHDVDNVAIVLARADRGRTLQSEEKISHEPTHL